MEAENIIVIRVWHSVFNPFMAPKIM